MMRDTSARPDASQAPEPEPEQAQDAAAPEAPQADPLAAIAQEVVTLKDKLLRALAEMENTRKRAEREIADSRTYAVTVFARDILTVADNMHRALNALDVELRERADASVKALLDGVELTERELLNVLDKHGVKKLEPLGQKFDPNRHQAMYEVPDSSAPAGSIVQVIQAGYTIGDRVLRPAMVAIAKSGEKPKADGEPPANDNSGAAA
jgi:molecular chaperone GrpE